MNLRIVTHLLVLYFCVSTKITTAKPRLKFVQALFRHGDRAPQISYPTDQWRNFWIEGLDQLTPLGKRQGYELGVYFGNRYQHFLNISGYVPTQIDVFSSDTDRTLMTAASMLAGMFPPQGKYVWQPNVQWQPLAIHTVPLTEDFMFNSYETCHRFDQLLEIEKASKEMLEVNKQYKDLFDLLTRKMGILVYDVYSATDVYDLFFVQSTHNLTWPKWLDLNSMKRLRQCVVINYLSATEVDEQKKLSSGVLLGKMTDSMEKAIKNEIQEKAIFYSAHDWNIVYLLTTLGVFNNQPPTYTTSVMVELLEENGVFFVQVFFRNETKNEPHLLTLPNCASLCPFETFKSLVQPYITNDPVKDCRVGPPNPIQYPPQIGILLVFTGLGTFITVVVYTVIFCYNPYFKFPIRYYAIV